MGKRLPSICVFCGGPATTRDHVPPRGIFAEPRPSTLVTVPACEACNNKASQHDEKFRNIIGLRADPSVPEALRLWLTKALPGLQRNRREMSSLQSTMHEVDLFNEDGTFIGRRTAAAFSKEAHDRTVERITRGLYFHHYGVPLLPSTSVDVFFIGDGKSWVNVFAEALPKMQVRNIGGKTVFWYAHGLVGDVPQASLWFYVFYTTHVAAAVTRVQSDLGRQTDNP